MTIPASHRTIRTKFESENKGSRNGGITLQRHDNLIAILSDPSLENRQRIKERAAIHHSFLALGRISPMSVPRDDSWSMRIVQAGIAREMNRIDRAFELGYFVRKKC